jgi:hypothetical protein
MLANRGKVGRKVCWCYWIVVQEGFENMQQVVMVTNLSIQFFNFNSNSNIQINWNSQNLQSQFKYHIPFFHSTFYKSDFFCNLFRMHLIEIASQIFLTFDVLVMFLTQFAGQNFDISFIREFLANSHSKYSNFNHPCSNASI